MTTRAKSRGVTLIPILALAACTPSPPERGPDEPSGAPAATSPSAHIDIPPTVQRNLGITFAEVELRRVAQTVRVPGAFELQPLARREYRMALPGHVQLHVDQYDVVEVGQVLFRYQSPAWPELLHEIIVGEQTMDTARAEIAVARATLAEARRKLELTRGRITALAEAESKAAGLEAKAGEIEASLPRLEAELSLAETRLANAARTREHAMHRASAASGIPEAELEATATGGTGEMPTYETVDWIEVRAARAGIVEHLAVTDGAFVEPPTTILATVDPKQVRFRALALQADLAMLGGTDRAHIVPPPSAGIPLQERVAASLAIGLEAHPKERTVTLIATPTEHAEWIRPGVSAFLELVAASTDGPALAVPRSAVVQDGLTHVFFRRDPADPNRALRVEADLGTSDGRWVVIQSGLMRGDEVVLDGVYELKLASQRTGAADAGGHVHADGSVHDDH